MKARFLSVAFFLFWAVKSFAQIEKGTVAAGGSATFGYQHFSTSAGSKEDEFTFSVSPNAGIFVAKNFMIGGHVGYTVTSNNLKENLIDIKSTAHTFSVGPDFRYYIKLTDKVYVHFLANVAFAVGKQTIIVYNEVNPASYTQIGANWNVGAGLSYFVNKSIAIAITPSYGGQYMKTTNGNQSNQLMNGFFLNAGFSIFIPRKNPQ